MEIRSRPCRSSSRSDLCLQSQGLPTTSTAEATTLAAILPAWRSWCSASHQCSWCQWHGILCLFAWRRNFHRVMGLLLQAWSHRPGLTVSRPPWAVHYHGPCLVQQRPTWPFADKVVPLHQAGLQSQRLAQTHGRRCLSKSVAEVLDHFLLR